MIAPEEIVNLAEFLKRKDFQSSPYQLFAARQVLLSEWGQETGAGSLVRLSTLLGPIFCRTAEEQQQFEQFYLQWLRQRSGRPKPSTTSQRLEGTQPEIPRVHWRMKLAAISLLILPLLTGWFLWQDLRPRQVEGKVLAEGKPRADATAQLGELATTATGDDGTFQLAFTAKDMPLELTVNVEAFLPSKMPVGESIKTNRNWFYFNPINLEDILDIGTIQLTKEEAESSTPDPTPDPSNSDFPPSELSIEKVAELTVPPPSWANRLDGWKAIGSLLPLLLALLWLAYRKLRQPSLQRQSSRIPPELKRVQVQTGTQQIFPSISLRHLTQRLRQPRFVETGELDVARTIYHTMHCGGLFTPVFGSRREPGYVALIDRATMADHQAHLAAQLVKDLAKGYVLVRQYEFDEQPTMLQRVDPLRPQAPGGVVVDTAPEVMPLEDLYAKFPARRVLCFGDPLICFDPLTGKLRPWVESLEGWEERYWFTANADKGWSQAERVLSRRGFQVIPLSHLGLRVFLHLLEQGSPPGSTTKPPVREPGSIYDRMPDRWLERHPPSHETTTRLLDDLQHDLGSQGMRWLAACAAYPEIHWALTLEWGVRLFGQSAIAETLFPKITRLVWLRHAFMPDWFRKALYDRLTPGEAERLSQELGEILSAVNSEMSGGLRLTIATRQVKLKQHDTHKGFLRGWVDALRRKLKLQAMGQVAEEGSPLRDYVMLQYLSGKQGKALTTNAPKALLTMLFPKGQPWLGFRPLALILAAGLLTVGLWWWLDPIPIPLPTPIQALAISSDGKTLAAGLEDGRLIEWDWQTKQIKLRYSGYPFAVTSVAVLNEGKFLVGGYQDGSIHVMDRNVGNETQVLRGHDSPVKSMAFWPSSDNVPRLVSADAKKYVVWSNWKSTQTEDFGYVDITDLAFTETGDWVAGGNSLGEIFTASAADSDLNHFFNLDLSFEFSPRDAGVLKHLAWDPTGTFLISLHADGILRIWENKSRQVVAKIQATAEGVSGLRWSSAEEAVLTVAGEGRAEVWRIHIPPQLLGQEKVQFPDGEQLAQQQEALPQIEEPPAQVEEPPLETTNPKSFLEKLIREPSRQVISAVSEGEIPLEFSEIQGGLFTHFLLKGLGEGFADINQDGYIPTRELFGYIRANVSEKFLAKRVSLTPSFFNFSGGKGDFVFPNLRSFPGDGREVLNAGSSGLGRAFALTIGIDNYRQGIPSLSYPVKDSRSLGNLLENFQFTVDYLLNEEATRNNIQKKIFEVLSVNGDLYARVLINFSGFGKTITMPNGEQREYLLPIDADPERIPLTGISLEAIIDLANLSKTKHVLIVLDAPVSVKLGRALGIDRMNKDKQQNVGEKTTIPNEKLPQKPMASTKSKNRTLQDLKPNLPDQQQQALFKQKQAVVQQQGIPQQGTQPLAFKGESNRQSPVDMICSSLGLDISPERGIEITDSLEVSQSGELTNLNVLLDITHSYVGDLVVSLKHATVGTTEVLLDRPIQTQGNCSFDDIQVTLDDDAKLSVQDTCARNPPAIGGTLRPKEPLSRFHGKELQGRWELTVKDTSLNDKGRLNKWCLIPK